MTSLVTVKVQRLKGISEGKWLSPFSIYLHRSEKLVIEIEKACFTFWIIDVKIIYVNNIAL